jgi:alcohol dehydrogenase class IV
MTTELRLPQRIVFGRDAARQIPALAAEAGTRVLLVTGAHADRWAALTADLARQGLPVTIFRVPHEPTFALARAGAAQAREAGANVVVAIGGGSVLDAGKAIAMLATNGGDPLDYAEVIGAGRPIATPSLPCIAVPTTAGTGAEATRNAVLGSPEHKVKVSLRGPGMLPSIALVDPALACGLPPDHTAAAGMEGWSAASPSRRRRCSW